MPDKREIAPFTREIFWLQRKINSRHYYIPRAAIEFWIVNCNEKSA